LIDLKHTRIGVILGSSRITSVHDRFTGFSKMMDEAGITIDPELVVHSQVLNPESGEIFARQLLSLSPRPSAIIAYCDTLAIGVYVAALKMGLSVPGDLSIVGYDDIIFASCFEVPLTTVAQPAYQMGQTACDIIIERIKAREEGLVLNNLPKKQVVFQPQLVVRKSCGVFAK
jgi:LacI family repressor for deo operon, udp, cdd, tsx, nupC, and nupG